MNDSEWAQCVSLAKDHSGSLRGNCCIVSRTKNQGKPIGVHTVKKKNPHYSINQHHQLQKWTYTIHERRWRQKGGTVKFLILTSLSNARDHRPLVIRWGTSQRGTFRLSCDSESPGSWSPGSWTDRAEPHRHQVEDLWAWEIISQTH